MIAFYAPRAIATTTAGPNEKGLQVAVDLQPFS